MPFEAIQISAEDSLSNVFFQHIGFISHNDSQSFFKTIIYPGISYQILVPVWWIWFENLSIRIFVGNSYSMWLSFVFDCCGFDSLFLRNKEIAKIVEIHESIIKFSGNVERIFSFSLFQNFFGSSVSICVTGFQMTDGSSVESSLEYLLLLFCNLLQVFLLCHTGTKLTKAAFDINWIADKRLKHLAMLMMIRAQNHAPWQLWSLRRFR